MNVVNSQSAQGSTLADTLLHLSKNAILVFEQVQIPVPTFRIKQANASVLKLADEFPTPLIGAYVDQLPVPFNSPYLVQQLEQALNQDIAARFQLIHPFPATGVFPIYDCQLVNVDNQLLVLSIEVINHLPERSDFLEEVLETMPIGLIIFRAIRNEQEEIIDFQATLCNQIGAEISRQSREDILARPISERYQDMKTFELFQHYVQVVTTGNSHHQLLYLPPQDIWLDVYVVKYKDGLLVSFQDVTLGQKTASLLESVMKSSPAAVRYYEAVRDETGLIIDFIISTGNELPAYRAFRPLESTVGRRMLELYPYLKVDGLFDRYAAVVETGHSDQFEVSYPHPLEGKQMLFDCTAVRHGNGFVLTSLDVTARKEAELAQQREAHLLQTVLDNSLTGIAWLKRVDNPMGQVADFTISMINATLVETLGTSHLAVEGKLLSVLMPHQMTNGLFERYAAVAQTARPQRFNWSNEVGSVWYDISVMPFEDGIIVTFMDITAIKLAQLDLERQAELITGVLNSSSSSILVFDAIETDGDITDFRVALANPATLSLFPRLVGLTFTYDDLMTHTMLDLLPESREKVVFASMVDVVKNRQAVHRQVEYPDLNLVYDYDISPFRNGVLIITTDVTALRQYQRKLEEKNAALSQSNEHLQQFAYVASHDLQEPLRKVRSLGELLASNYASQLGPNGISLLERIQTTAARMDTLIRDLLAYSRLTTKERVLEPQDLNQILTGVLSDLEVTIQQKGVTLELTHLPIIQGDALQLRQLLQNLLSNALKFIRPDVPPVIRIDCRVVLRTEVIDLPLELAGDSFYEISISDNGIGFEQAFADRIFQMFQRLHNRQHYSGTGMGLAICKKIVENHHGFITAHSQPNQGSTFTIYLPQTSVAERQLVM
ncbi:ATP-binding protein [Spirosoma soli]|uniref:histidine kinase n=1 Tax=Spirosoma soli TaxID=1770529 RepID=A0ABW5M2E0_9BACT